MLMFERLETIQNAILTGRRFYGSRFEFKGSVYNGNGDLLKRSQRAPDKFANIDVDYLDPSLIGSPMEKHGIYLGDFFLHFGHFMIETLPSLYWSRFTTAPIYMHPWGYDDREAFERCEWVTKIIGSLGIDWSRINLVYTARRVKSMKIIPRGDILNGKLADHRTLSVYDDVRRGLRCKQGSVGKVYFSRKNWNNRVTIPQEALVEAEFVRRGYSVVVPESISIEEQISLVSGADVVAGISGSALHLSGFMKSGSTVISLGRRDLKALFAINDQIGVETHELDVCKASGPNREFLTIDLKKLSDELDLISHTTLKVKA